MHLAPVNGFWGTPTASVDWCEIDYEHSRHVCELFNTVSSLAMVVVGLLGWSAQRGLGARFRVLNALLCLVGLGSMAFHATLRFEFQTLDELPMVYVALVVLYILLEDRREPRWGAAVPVVLAGAGALLTCLDVLLRGRAQ